MECIKIHERRTFAKLQLILCTMRGSKSKEQHVLRINNKTINGIDFVYSKQKGLVKTIKIFLKLQKISFSQSISFRCSFAVLTGSICWIMDWSKVKQIFQNFPTQWLCCLVNEFHTVVIHAVVHWLHRLVLFLLTFFECLNAWILLNISMKGGTSCLESTLCWVTSFCVDFAEHLNSLILSMTTVWLIQQAHWADTSSVRLWHLEEKVYTFVNKKTPRAIKETKIGHCTSYCWQLHLSSYPCKVWYFLSGHPYYSRCKEKIFENSSYLVIPLKKWNITSFFNGNITCL